MKSVLAAAAAVALALAGAVATAPSGLAETRATSLQISYLPVDLAKKPYAWPSNVQDFPARVFPPIHVFGRTYQGHVEPTLMIDMLKIGTPVIAGFDGDVVRVTPQPDSCDAEVYIESGDPVNHASYDHIIPSVRVGTHVTAGQVIGKVGAWQCTSKYGGVELMVVAQTPQGMKAVCPMTLLAPSRAAALRAQVLATMKAWNAHAAGAPTAYTKAELARGICSVPTTSAN